MSSSESNNNESDCKIAKPDYKTPSYTRKAIKNTMKKSEKTQKKTQRD